MPEISAQTVVIGLEKSEDDLFNSLDKRIRYDIRKAKNKGVSVEEKNDKDSKEICYEIYKKMCKEHYLKAEPSEKLFREGNILFAALFENKIISFAVVGKRKDEKDTGTITIKYNATLSDYRQLQPTTLLYWESIVWAKKHRYKNYDLGGIDLKSKDPQTKSRNSFKLRWGGRIVEKKTNINFAKWIYWRFLRHFPLIRKLNYIFRGKK